MVPLLVIALILHISAFSDATDCDIKIQGFRSVPIFEYQQPIVKKRSISSTYGFIEVNGRRVIDFGVPDYYSYCLYQYYDSDIYDPGLWVAAITPACEVMDVTLFHYVNETEDYYFYQGNGHTYTDAVYLDSYIQSWPRGTIFAGASSDDLRLLLTPEDCATIAEFDQIEDTICHVERSRYFLAALGLQDRYVPELSHDGYPGVFVAVKGKPEKARYNFLNHHRAIVGMETTVTTPNALVCLPMQPMLTVYPHQLAIGDIVIPLQPVLCTGNITAWKFVAVNVGQIIFDVWRKYSDGYRVVTSTTVSTMNAGENIHCLDTPIPVIENDLVGARYPDGYSGLTVLPITYKSDFDLSVSPLCPQEEQNGLTVADLVPLFIGTIPSVTTVTIPFVDLDFNADPADRATADFGAVSFHPYMNTDFKLECSCEDNSDCHSWDVFSKCDSSVCRCEDGFILDQNTLSCVHEDLAAGRSVYTSGMLGGPATGVTDGDENTCVILAEADRPWLIVDLGEEMTVHGVSLTVGTTALMKLNQYTVNVPTSQVNAETGETYWPIIMQDISGDNFHHPPCAKISNSDPDFEHYIEDVNINHIWITVVDESGTLTGDVVDDLDIDVYEPQLFNYNIGVGTPDTLGGFDPSMFDLCTHYNGNAMGGNRLHVSCDKMVTGRYIIVYQPGDGVTGQMNWETPPDRQDFSFTLCDINVHGLPVRPFGFPCSIDAECSIPSLSPYLKCEDGTCHCIDGYLENTATESCDDINECQTANGNCSQICENTPGSFVCKCTEYYKLDTDMFGCVDVDECTEKTVCQQTCINTVVPYECGCNTGYTLTSDLHTCLDTNECLVSSSCDATNGRCENNPGSFECFCNIGYVLDYDMKTCNNVNECGDKNGGCDQVCTDNTGSYVCTCNSGYDLQDDEASCVDNNECSNSTYCAGDHMLCDNTVGSYSCLCENGWELLADVCQDINECSAGTAFCEQECSNSDGSYICTCGDGYDLARNGFSCIDIDECENDTICDTGNCFNKDGTYDCNCDVGWIFDGSSGTCTDANECENGYNGGCAQSCLNSLGSYTCSCGPGYTLAIDGHYCQDDNECSEPANCALNHMLCENTVGSYTCLCEKGWELLNDECKEIDECSTGISLCEQGCSNSPEGSYTCTCVDGYLLSPNRINCIDVDECGTPAYCAMDHMLCDNTVGSYTCFCENGWELKDGKCNDVDECETTPYVCEHICVNSEPGYECKCFTGYDLNPNDERGCFDTNECDDPTICEDTGECFNKVGTFDCHCNVGWVFVESTQSCTDENECENGYNAGCTQKCSNIEGSYTCSCNDGYTLASNGHHCQDLDECLVGSHTCDQLCSNTHGSYLCICNKGFMMDDSKKCQDVDECSAGTALCEQGCSNSPDGSYTCTCHDGYLLASNGFNCKDVDECANSANCAMDHMLCVNTVGSYTCFCKNGWEMIDAECKDLNECETTPSMCEHICVNSEPGFECQCRPGYYLNDNDKSSCYDINECEDATTCEDTGECYNKDGTYDCYCRVGWVFDESTQNCTDDNECKDGYNGGCAQICSNTLGSYICLCAAGYTVANNGKHCQDLDECFDGSHTCEQLCSNTHGSYLCTCKKGFMMDDSGKCQDIDECSLEQTPCWQNCTNTEGGYDCSCQPGYNLRMSFFGEGICEDIDECSINNAGCSDLCINSAGTFKCFCNSNKKLAEDNRECVGPFTFMVESAYNAAFSDIYSNADAPETIALKYAIREQVLKALDNPAIKDFHVTSLAAAPSGLLVTFEFDLDELSAAEMDDLIKVMANTPLSTSDFSASAPDKIPQVTYTGSNGQAEIWQPLDPCFALDDDLSCPNGCEIVNGDPTCISGSSNNTIILASVIPSVLLLIFLIVLIVWCVARRRADMQKSQAIGEPEYNYRRQYAPTYRSSNYY